MAKQGFFNAAKNAAGLAIKTASSPDALSANSVVYTIGDSKYQVAAQATIDLSAANLPEGGSLVITTAYTNVVTVAVDSAGTVSTYLGTQATTFDGVVLNKDVPNTSAVLGYIIIANATGSDFTVGTTALDTASVTDTYLDAVGIDPLV